MNKLTANNILLRAEQAYGSSRDMLIDYVHSLVSEDMNNTDKIDKTNIEQRIIKIEKANTRALFPDADYEKVCTLVESNARQVAQEINALSEGDNPFGKGFELGIQNQNNMIDAQWDTIGELRSKGQMIRPEDNNFIEGYCQGWNDCYQYMKDKGWLKPETDTEIAKRVIGEYLKEVAPMEGSAGYDGTYSVLGWLDQRE